MHKSRRKAAFVHVEIGMNFRFTVALALEFAGAHPGKPGTLAALRETDFRLFVSL